MTELEAIARGVHEAGSVVPWGEAHKERRAFCFRTARTIHCAREMGQTMKDAADRLIVWWQVDNKELGRKGRAFAPEWLVAEMDKIVLAGLKGLAKYV